MDYAQQAPRNDAGCRSQAGTRLGAGMHAVQLRISAQPRGPAGTPPAPSTPPPPREPQNTHRGPSGAANNMGMHG